MDHVTSLGEILHEAVQAPHEVVGDQVESTALPVYQHGCVGLLQLLLHFLKQKVVDLGVTVNQSGKILNVTPFQIQENSEQEFAELGQNLQKK